MDRLDSLLQQLSYQDEFITSIVNIAQASNNEERQQSKNHPFHPQEMSTYFFNNNEEYRNKLFARFEANKETFLNCHNYGEEKSTETQEKFTLERTKQIVREHFFSVYDLIK